MKTAVYFKSISVAVLFASVLASCSKDILSDDRPSGVYTFTLSDDGSKAVLAENDRGKYGHWESGDKLGTVVESNAPAYSYVTVGTPSKFNIYRPGGLKAGESLYVYYPYDELTESATAVWFEIPTTQDQIGAQFDYDAMPMAAAPFVIPEIYAGGSGATTQVGDIHLYNLASMVEFQLFSSEASFRNETVQGVLFQAVAPIAGGFTKDITLISSDDESSLAITGYSEAAVETLVESAPSMGSTRDDALSVYMVLAPGSYTGTVTVVTDAAEYSFTLSSPQTFKRSVIRSFAVDLARGTRTANPVQVPAYFGCIEVPTLSIVSTASGYETRTEYYGFTPWQSATLDGDKLIAVTHTFEYNGQTLRNYTTCVDGNKRCPLWSAYPMHGGAYPNNDCGRWKAGFSESHSYDPAVPQEWQSSGSTSDYNSGNGFSRGHLCASEDRQIIGPDNKQTFYYTNQAPQWQNNFNGGIWATLETAVQNKAANLTGRDTLYVVSGTLYENEVFAPSNDGGQVARPSHFYKLLMLCSFNASGEITGASGAAYVYTNEAHKGVSYYDQSFKTTIDAIEQRAGFDFFPRVPADLQEAAESVFSNLL